MSQREISREDQAERGRAVDMALDHAETAAMGDECVDISAQHVSASADAGGGEGVMVHWPSVAGADFAAVDEVDVLLTGGQRARFVALSRAHLELVAKIEAKHADTVLA